MDFMKVIDQTVREIKREVNLKVLKVPEMEQKVLDATDNEPWGPHGTALAEIAHATKKFTECQMVMNVLWTRLGETGKDWRYVYKALAVIEYLISHGSEHAVDEIIERTFQISSLTSFEYVEPSGKDMGISVRKKAENIVALLNNKDKIEEVRNKAAANRDKYFGLSSTGITYKSGTTSYGGSYQSNRRNYDSYKDRDYCEDEKTDYDPYGKSHRGVKREVQGYTSKKSFSRKDQEHTGAHKLSSKQNDSDKNSSFPSQISGAPLNENGDFDDFDPRGTSSNKSITESAKQVDLFGQDLLGDLMDAPMPAPTESFSANNNASSVVDLFADATFVSASPQQTGATGSQTKKEVDLFASSEASVPFFAAPQTIDPFASHEPIVQSEVKPSKPDSTSTTNIADPFASVPLNNFDESDPFGDFTSHSGSASTDAPNPVTDKSTNNISGSSVADSKLPPQKKETFQVKSGIWADTLSRGLIDLNITAPKKVSLANVGVVGGLNDLSDEREKKGSPASFYMGQAMGTGSGLGRTGYSATGGGSDDFFSSLGSFSK